MPVAFSICVVYSVFASAVLVVCTLLNRRRQAEPLGLARSLEYVPISESVLLGWARKCSNLVIFDLHAWDLHPRLSSKAREEFAACYLPISVEDLPGILRWLPPRTRVMFFCRCAAEHWDFRTESELLRLGIETVYFLDDQRPLPEEVNSGMDRFTNNSEQRNVHENHGSGSSCLHDGYIRFRS